MILKRGATGMMVTQLARRAGVTAEAVRHYTRIGLLRPRRGGANGYKYYTDADLDRLHFIRRAQRLGFSLADIGAVLAEAERGGVPCPQVRAILQQRLHETHRQIDDLNRLRDRMQQALAAWSALPDQAPHGDAICHLIESLRLED